MSNHNTLFNNSMHFVCSSRVRFHDLRVLTTFVWAITGMLISESINLSHWLLYRPGSSKASSKQRQLSRWLHNPKIKPMAVYRPFIQQALAEWAEQTLYLALDTSQLWRRKGNRIFDF